MRKLTQTLRPFTASQFLFLLLLTFSPSALAQSPTFTLPLHGYYHPGRYMPVRIGADTTVDTGIRLSAPGAMATWVPFHAPFEATFPFLPIDSRVQSINWWHKDGPSGTIETPLHPLSDHQRLIGFTLPDEAAARQLAAQLFPGDELILLRLSDRDPTPGTPAAWESLDALLINTPAIAGLDEQRLEVLIACGVVVVMRADHAPSPHWPWEPVDVIGTDHWWRLHHEPSGPRAATVNDAFYRPVTSWRPGWPPEFRRRLVLMAVVFSVLALAIALFRPPLTAVWMLGLSGLALAGLAAFWKFQTPLVQRNGEVILLGRHSAQIDDWTYQTSFRPMIATVNWGDYTKPFFTSSRHLERSNPSLRCHPNGDPDVIEHQVGGGLCTALMMRRVGPRGPDAIPSQPATSPLLPVVKEMYLLPGDRVSGELPSAPLLGTPYAGLELWPAIVIQSHDK